MPSIICPIPSGIAHEDARAIFNQVRKEHPKLTPAAQRREAARRMGTDYDTYLQAWKKPTTTPVTPPPVVVPDPPIKLPDLPTPAPEPAPVMPTLNHDTARAQYKLVKKENKGWTDAQIRREAAKRMNVDYDTYLKHWKGDKSAPTPKTPAPNTVPATPVKVIDQGMALNKASVERYLKSKGHKISHKTKERFTHSGQSYGGGIADTEGISVQESAFGDSVTVRIRPGFRSPAEVERQRIKLMDQLRDAGYTVEKVTNLELRVTKVRAKRSVNDPSNPFWKTKSVDGPVPRDITIEDGYIYDGQQSIGRIVYERGFYRFRPNYGYATDLNPNIIFNTYEDAVSAAKKTLSEDLGKADHQLVNRGRKSGVPGTQKNCTSCTSSYELRRRGFDVEARKMPSGQALSDIYRSWGIRVQDQLQHGISTTSQSWSFPVSTTRQAMIDDMKKLPDGARGFISTDWRRGGAHIYNWEIRDGDIWFIDAQVSEEWKFTTINGDRHLSRAKDDLWAARVDELDPDPELLDWITSDHGQVPISNAPRWVTHVTDKQRNVNLS